MNFIMNFIQIHVDQLCCGFMPIEKHCARFVYGQAISPVLCHWPVCRTDMLIEKVSAANTLCVAILPDSRPCMTAWRPCLSTASSMRLVPALPAAVSRACIAAALSSLRAACIKGVIPSSSVSCSCSPCCTQAQPRILTSHSMIAFSSRKLEFKQRSP